MYLSRLLGTPVQDSSDAQIGTLADILIEPNSGVYSPLTFLVVKHRERERYISYDFVASLGSDVVALKYLSSSVPDAVPPEGSVRLKRDVLDQQIVDVEGARVVRVNDLKIGLVSESMSVIGIDISWRGVLRRLGLARFDLFNLFKVNLIDWRKAQPLKGTLKLDTAGEQLKTLHPADLANIVEDLNVKQGSHIVGSLDTKMAAKVVEEMSPEIQRLVMRYLGPERAARIMESMSSDETVDLLKMLPTDEAKKFLSYLQEVQIKRVQKLLSYPDDTAGGLMTLDYVSARPDWTVQSTIAEIRRASPNMRSLLYVYVTDDAGKLKGAISLRGLLVAKPDALVKDIMKKLPKSSLLKLHDHVNRVIKIMTKYNLFTAAVLDRDQRMAGVLTIDDVMRHLVPNA